jgi:hypothetical protein
VKLTLKRSFDLPAYDLVSTQDKVGPVFEVSVVGFNNDHTRALVGSVAKFSFEPFGDDQMKLKTL